ncbi:MAG TPA: MFS transporter [Planctomycetota bacterium]|nr:MFS transporter [Planctomycetota bacterium]
MPPGSRRDLVVLLAAILVVATGQELWVRFAPLHLVALGASAFGASNFGVVRDALDSFCQIPGGWLHDRLGRRAALPLFALAASAGCLLCAAAPTPGLFLLGFLLAGSFDAFTQPATFAATGDALAPGGRAKAFAVLGALKRVPRVVGPPVGGALIGWVGISRGVRAGLLATAALGIGCALLQRRLFAEAGEPAERERHRAPFREIWRGLPPSLRRILLADVFARLAEGIPSVFLSLYVVERLGLSEARFGTLVAVQSVVAVLSYLPAAPQADRAGGTKRTPWIVATFLCFALFPAAVALARDFSGLCVAFAIGGLREIGEPARKARIVDLTPPERRGRAAGLYYFVRGLAVIPSSWVGAWLWGLDARAPFLVAAVAGGIGVGGFLLMEGRRSSVSK